MLKKTAKDTFMMNYMRLAMRTAAALDHFNNQSNDWMKSSIRNKVKRRKSF